jgi:hypothetical protein
VTGERRKSPYFTPEWRLSGCGSTWHIGPCRLGDWPTWLTADAFAGWYHEQNRLRVLNGDDPLPDVPRSVAVELADAEEREGRARETASNPALWAQWAVVYKDREDKDALLDARREALVADLVRAECGQP